MSLKDNDHISYINQLTWLRGIAAFFVIVSHTLRALEVKYSSLDQAIYPVYMYIFDLGNFGVVLFFVLSGCTLYISNSEKVSRQNIYAFYIKRFFRIWPAFAIALIIYIAFSFIFLQFYTHPQGYWIEKQFITEYTFIDIIKYLSLVFNFTGPSGLFNNAFWSLPVEFQYYLIFPLIVFAIKTTGIIGPLVISVIFYITAKLGFYEFFDKDTVFTLAYSFCGGVIIGYLYLNYSYRLGIAVSLLLLALAMSLIISIERTFIQLPALPIVGDKWTWRGLVGIAVVFITLFTKFNIHTKADTFLKHYGTISYSTYLYHNLFIRIAILLLIEFEIHDSTSRILLTTAFAFLLNYIAAVISYKYIEKPFISFGRKFIPKK